MGGTTFEAVDHRFLHFPDPICNPGLFGHAGEPTNKTNFDKTSIIGLVIWILCILYSSLRSASKVAQVAIPDPEKQGKDSRFIRIRCDKECFESDAN